MRVHYWVLGVLAAAVACGVVFRLTSGAGARPSVIIQPGALSIPVHAASAPAPVPAPAPVSPAPLPGYPDATAWATGPGYRETAPEPAPAPREEPRTEARAEEIPAPLLATRPRPAPPPETVEAAPEEPAPEEEAPPPARRRRTSRPPAAVEKPAPPTFPGDPPGVCQICGERADSWKEVEGLRLGYCMQHYGPSAKAVSPPGEMEGESQAVPEPAESVGGGFRASSSGKPRAVQCRSLTRSRLRCRRKTTDPTRLCYQHRR